ncbi:helix-turn-helix domain-containing protein [Mucilaginibacter daejeonensis]|uniref:helix-turn-helix transcriptional regulator n=1 Tax=Mucilaginibacter daejeonensis TaxID=398049 RepID=UPI001D173EEA|nr:helix-turn-helix transcriptional regulator [Mucilaginibacter daejeonensis]UEG54014.1 helix-turn-helix domain-containing protein [Mucilaginibacter daejeonensis]
MAETLHIGRKIARIRELKGIKQEALAIELNVTQQTVSNIEKSDKIEDELLETIAKALGVPTEAIKNFNDEAVIHFIANTYNDNAASYGHYYNFSPIEKIVTLYDEKVALLERLLASEREKVELLKNSK